MRNLLTAVLTASLLTATTPLSAQQSTDSDSMTLTVEQLAAVVDQSCGEARALADEADGLRVQRDTMRAQRDQCIGQVMALDDDGELQREVGALRVWLVVGIVAGFVAGGVVGWMLPD
jgi:hypothetical protein